MQVHAAAYLRFVVQVQNVTTFNPAKDLRWQVNQSGALIFSMLRKVFAKVLTPSAESICVGVNAPTSETRHFQLKVVRM